MLVQTAAQERNWAMAAHLSALVAIAGIPFGHVLGPLVVYLIKGHESEFIGEHARASLNFQITLTLLTIVGVIVAVAATFGFIVPLSLADSTGVSFNLAALWIAFGVACLVVLVASVLFIILGALAASEGRTYNYPFAIRFLR
jgi:uncharacterized Tic20 family protein